MSEREMLDEHGTQLTALPAGAIISTAKADLKRRERNVARAEREERGYEQYAYVAAHVRRSRSPLELIKLALKENDKGRASGKLNTRRIYRNVSTLFEAADRLEVLR